MKLAQMISCMTLASCLHGGEMTTESKKNAYIQTVLQGREEVFSSIANCSSLANAEFLDTPSMFIYASGMNFPPLNGIVEKDQNRTLSEKEIESGIQLFTAKNIPFLWWTADESLESKGFQFGGILTGIALDISQEMPEKPLVSEQLEIKVATTQQELSDFSVVMAECHGMNPEVAEQFLDISTKAMEKGKQIHFMAYLGEIPVGTATLSTESHSAGIWNMATLPEYRKQGIGAALAYAALQEAKKEHYDQVMAILMPKGMAWGLFAQLGFEEACTFPFYVYGVSAEELEK